MFSNCLCTVDVKNQPLCYNNKMMNSIWGQYNMYSVHNIKALQNDAAFKSNVPLQQMFLGDQNEPCINLSKSEDANNSIK